MYKLKLATKEKDILEFEKKRVRSFAKGKELESLERAAYAKEIQQGDLLAFLCMKEDQAVGGMLIEPKKRWLLISRIFVDEDKRGQGAGTFMLDYVDNHREFFEDYYACDFDGVLVEPLESSIDYYFDKGYDYYGFQMYKRYEK